MYPKDITCQTTCKNETENPLEKIWQRVQVYNENDNPDEYGTTPR
jgi:hypothetical protein